MGRAALTEDPRVRRPRAPKRWQFWTALPFLMIASFYLGRYTHPGPLLGHQETLVVQDAIIPRKLQMAGAAAAGTAGSEGAAMHSMRQTLPDESLSSVAADPTAAAAVEPLQAQPVAPLPDLAAPGTPQAAHNNSSLLMPESDIFGQLYLLESGLLHLRPALQPGESGDEYYNVIPYQVLSWHPRIVLLPNFVDKYRSEYIVALASGKMKPSEVRWKVGQTPDKEQQQRTSSGAFLHRHEDAEGVLGWLEDKIARFTLLPATHGEGFNVLRYESDQYYVSHMDTFDERWYGKQKSQRIATMLVYLTDVEEGGETVFKKEGKDGLDRHIGDSFDDFKHCKEKDFKYKPRQGDALLFFSADPDLSLNMRATHGGCPVRRGTKWVATKWLHEKPVKPPGF